MKINNYLDVLVYYLFIFKLKTQFKQYNFYLIIFLQEIQFIYYIQYHNL